MKGDWLVLGCAFLGLLAKVYATPPRWTFTVAGGVELLMGSAGVLLLYALVPPGWIPAALTTNDLRLGAAIAFIAFALGPGVVTIAKALLWERLPRVVQGMLPPPTPPGSGS